MSPLLLHGSTNQYNIKGFLCTYTEMFRIQTCCNYNVHFISCRGVSGAGGNMRESRIFCQSYLVLSLFNSLQRGPMVLLLRKLYLYFTKDPEGVHYFPGGGGVSNFFQGEGGGPNANFFRNPCSYLLFSRGGGVRTPYPPLDPHIGNAIITGQYLSQSCFIIVRH